LNAHLSPSLIQKQLLLEHIGTIFLPEQGKLKNKVTQFNLSFCYPKQKLFKNIYSFGYQSCFNKLVFIFLLKKANLN
jgi:hypothetical protein